MTQGELVLLFAGVESGVGVLADARELAAIFPALVLHVDLALVQAPVYNTTCAQMSLRGC